MSASVAWVARVLSGLAGIAILAVLVLGPVTAQFRFADQLRPYGSAIFGQVGPVDVVFIGTSRTRRAIMAQRLELLLGEKLNRPVVVQDLAKTGGGTDADYLLLRERLNHSSVRLVVMEYRAVPQPSNHFHFIQAATWGDILTNAWSLDGAWSHLAFTARTKLAMFMTQLTAGHWFWPPARPSQARTIDDSPPAGANVAQLHRAAAEGRQSEPPLPLGEPNNTVQDTYIRKTIELVRSQGGEIVLMRIPALDEQAMTEAERERLGRYFGVEVFTLNETELARFTPYHYSDAHHHGWLALDLYLPIVAQWLAPKLTGPERSAGAL